MKQNTSEYDISPLGLDPKPVSNCFNSLFGEIRSLLHAKSSPEYLFSILYETFLLSPSLYKEQILPYLESFTLPYHSFTSMEDIPPLPESYPLSFTLSGNSPEHLKQDLSPLQGIEVLYIEDSYYETIPDTISDPVPSYDGTSLLSLPDSIKHIYQEDTPPLTFTSLVPYLVNSPARDSLETLFWNFSSPPARIRYFKAKFSDSWCDIPRFFHLGMSGYELRRKPWERNSEWKGTYSYAQNGDIFTQAHDQTLPTCLANLTLKEFFFQVAYPEGSVSFW